MEKWPTPRIENFRYMLRSGMMGWLTIMQDTKHGRRKSAAAKAEFALYKRKLRPLIRDADLYHVSARPDGVHWDGVEYFDASAEGVSFMPSAVRPAMRASIAFHSRVFWLVTPTGCIFLITALRIKPFPVANCSTGG